MGYLMPLAFVAAGIILIVLEMISLTFYMAALVVAAASVVALPLAHLLRHRMQGSKADPLGDMDKGGQVIVAEAGGGVLRVKYRDSLWEAVWDGAGSPSISQRGEITARDGSRLRIKPLN